MRNWMRSEASKQKECTSLSESWRKLEEEIQADSKREEKKKGGGGLQHIRSGGEKEMIKNLNTKNDNR